MPPGGKETVIRIDSTGKGIIPEGVIFKDTVAPSILNRFRNKCWTVEVRNLQLSIR